MTQLLTNKRGRGRPPKTDGSHLVTRDRLIRVGIEVLTETGFASAGLDQILKRAEVPKGSFYHYFKSKEEFGCAVIAAYGIYFRKKLDKCLLNKNRAPLDRLHDFVAQGKAGIERFEFRRGCLIGNMGQELGGSHEQFALELEAVFREWQACVATCFDEARELGELSKKADSARLAAFFWMGWEGAIIRAKLTRSVGPLDLFSEEFFKNLPYNKLIPEDTNK